MESYGIAAGAARIVGDLNAGPGGLFFFAFVRAKQAPPNVPPSRVEGRNRGGSARQSRVETAISARKAKRPLIGSLKNTLGAAVGGAAPRLPSAPLAKRSYRLAMIPYSRKGAKPWNFMAVITFYEFT